MGGGCYYDEPKSDLIRDHNPTCDINLYDGGLSCCHNGMSLLDADQEIPPLEDSVYYKWRFYYEPLAPTPAKQTFHLEWQLEKSNILLQRPLPAHRWTKPCTPSP